MTEVWLAGAENPQQHVHLSTPGVSRVAFNVGSWARNYRDRWALGFQPQEWIAWTDEDTTPIEDLADAIDAVGSTPRLVVGPVKWADAKGYLPLWNGEGEMPRQFIESGLVVTDQVFSDKAINKRVLSARRRDSILGVVTGKRLGVDRYDLVISSAWQSVQRNGETQVWDGKKLCRYNASDKDRVRLLHRDDIEALGVDPDRVLADDTFALTELAVLSWLAFDASVANDPIAVVSNPAMVTQAQTGSPSRALATVVPRDRHVLPVIAQLQETLTGVDGTQTEQVTLRSKGDSLRSCNNCFLQDSCPAFNPGHSCAYSIPVTIQSKEQLNAVLTAVLEIQTQRVLQARFAEEITGQELSPEVGREMDRLFGLTAKTQEILDNHDSLKITVDARGASASGGVLSQLFGPAAGAQAQALPEPLESDVVLAEVVGET